MCNVTEILQPTKTVRKVTTREGVALDIRLADEHDEAALTALFAQVSDEDRCFRFLTAAPCVTSAQIDPLIHTDHFHTESFLAFDQATGHPVASALLACDRAMDTAEIAVSVRQDYRGKGVGWVLLDLLSDEAHMRGVGRVISIENRANRATIELEREKGFIARAVDGDPALVMLSKSFR
ncbi:GNAT family N-acetyltransferase [Sphingobium sp. CR28]|uniref:GNAT family N-acetyltransferase n=1 Tax=Sphingobium sp. CR28 TaxID=3400272 RepID=UPI003FEE5409